MINMLFGFLMVASFGSWQPIYNRDLAGYHNSTIQIQMTEYNIGIGDDNYEPLTFTSDILFNGIAYYKDDGSAWFLVDSVEDQTFLREVAYDEFNYTSVGEGISVVGNSFEFPLKDTFITFNCTSYSSAGGYIRFRPEFTIINEANSISESFGHVVSYAYEPPLHSAFLSSNLYGNFNSVLESLENQYSKDFNNFYQGYDKGFREGREVGKVDGYADGYDAGFDAGTQFDTTAYTIFNGILNVGMLPINVLLAMMNFEVFGINISAFVMSLLTIAMTFIVIRMFMGGKGEK